MKIGFSEYVSLGHPDKIADYISCYILDRYLEQDPNTRFALEVQIKDNFVSLGGEITSSANFTSYETILFAMNAVDEIGYTKAYQNEWGKENTICGDDLVVTQHIGRQSQDIAQGVDADGWGDQGIMFGMAVNSPETNYMPKDIFAARKIGMELFERKLAGLDIKTQISVIDNSIVKAIVAIPMLEKHSKSDVENVVKAVCGSGDYDIIINGTGKYVKHSSIGDCGTTGRKLAVDFYGGNCNIGGGSPWTKDATKADLTLNLYARKKAVDFVKKTGVKFCKCGIACCIGQREIEVFLVDENGEVLEAYKENKHPEEIIELFNLKKPVFCKMCYNGLFW